jgi:hypothetical protein
MKLGGCVGEVRNPDVFAHIHAEMSHTITIVHATTTWKLLHSMKDAIQHAYSQEYNPKGKHAAARRAWHSRMA